MTTPTLHRDFADMIVELQRAGAEFVVVGGYAVGAWGHLRATKDLDILVRPSPDNAPRVLEALMRFGAPMHDLNADDLATPGTIFQIGVAPRRIDIITAAEGITYDDAVRELRIVDVGELTVPFIGLAALMKNKRAVGRPEDMRDVRELQKIHTPTKKRTKAPRR